MEDLEKRKLQEEQEIEKRKRDEGGADVEAHKFKKHSEDGSDDDTPDVEAHKFKI